MIEDEGTEVFVSAATAWEISINAASGKLPGALDVAADVLGCIRAEDAGSVRRDPRARVGDTRQRHDVRHQLMYATSSTEAIMRTTMNIDDELLKEAHELTGIKERTMLIHEGLRSLIQKEAARRLILLGGSDPGARRTPRRRSPLVKPARASGGGKRT